MNFFAFLITRIIESHFNFATHFVISFHQAHDIDFSESVFNCHHKIHNIPINIRSPISMSIVNK